MSSKSISVGGGNASGPMPHHRASVVSVASSANGGGGGPEHLPVLTRQPTLPQGAFRRDTRKRTFIMQIQDQLELQRQLDIERERQQEIRNLHRILQRPPDARDVADIDLLYDWVMRNGSTNKIFQGAQEIICKTICREMTLLELPAKGIVCYQGDYGDIFFIIISGSVSLYVDSKRRLRPTSDNDEEPSDKDRLRALQRDGDLDDNESDFNPEVFGSFIKQIGAGGTFGELAVMDPTARRSCTIFCDVPTSFICLKRGAYQRLIRITNSSQLDFTQVEFLETLFFFHRWPHSELTRVSNRLRHMMFPAETFLTRIGTEANLVFFIYSGMVQETVPLVHHLNENGNIYKCTTLEADSALRSMQDLSLADHRQQQLYRRRVALELTLYQDHDICGEYPIFFNKPMSNTDLLAVTDVKALVMDRETWRDVFFTHVLDHIKEAHHKFRQIAQARENWRQTRIRLAVANPNLHLTISTKAMMHDGRCMCAWCGSDDHITGDPICSILKASKVKQADKQQQQKNAQAAAAAAEGNNGKSSPLKKKGAEINNKAHIVKNTLNFVNHLAETASHRKASAIAMGLTLPDSRATTPVAPSTPNGGVRGRMTTLKVAAQRIIEDNSSRPATAASQTPETGSVTGNASPPSSPRADALLRRSSSRRLTHRVSSVGDTPVNNVPESPSPRRMSVAVTAANAIHLSMAVVPQPSPTKMPANLYDVYQALGEHEMDQETTPRVEIKVEEVRKSAFTEGVAHEYRQVMIQKAKRMATVQQYYDTRSQILDDIRDRTAQLPDQRYENAKIPRKPKIPKPNRRLAMCSKTREPRPDRFNRRINRALKKMWKQDHPLPVVEESLRDS